MLYSKWLKGQSAHLYISDYYEWVRLFLITNFEFQFSDSKSLVLKKRSHLRSARLWNSTQLWNEFGIRKSALKYRHFKTVKKHWHGIGRNWGSCHTYVSRATGGLKPRIVLYNERGPDADAIGKVSEADVRRVPDVVMVVGTSLTNPGVRRLVKKLFRATRSKQHGPTAWLNVDPPPQETNNLWNLVIRGRCDDFARLNLPGRTSDKEYFKIITSPTDLE